MMNTNPRRTIRFAAVLAAGIWLFPAFSVIGQDTQDQDPLARGARLENDLQILIQFKNTNAQEAVLIAKSIQPNCRFGVDRTSNTLVVSGPADAVATIENVLKKLDSEASDKDDIHSAIIRLDPDSARGVQGLIRPLITDRTEFSFDQHTGMLVLRGPAGEIAEVQRLIEAIQKDLPAAQTGGLNNRPLQLSFYFIQGMMNGGDQVPKEWAQTGAMPRSQSEADRYVLTQLDTPATAQFERHELQHVFNTLAEKGELNLAVMWEDLEENGVDKTTPVTLKLPNPVPLRTIFETVFEMLRSQADIGLVVKDGIVKIASSDILDRDAYIVVYDVADLLDAAPVYYRSRAKGMTSPSAGGLGGGGGGGGVAGNGFNGDAGKGGQAANAPLSVGYPVHIYQILTNDPHEELADELLDVIVNSVRPDSWRESGGSYGNAQIMGENLVIKQTASAHAEIANLLGELHKQRQLSYSTASFVPLPENLHSVAGALAESGFKDTSLLAALSVRTREKERFQMTSTAAELEGGIHINVEGRAIRQGDSDLIKIELGAFARPRIDTLGEKPEPLFEVETTLTARIGDYVILAASPAPTGHGQALALAVRVTEDK